MTNAINKGALPLIWAVIAINIPQINSKIPCMNSESRQLIAGFSISINSKRGLPLAVGSRAAALGCAETHPAALSPADVALFPTSLGAAEGCEVGSPRPSDPQAEGRPGSTLRRLPARPAAKISPFPLMHGYRAYGEGKWAERTVSCFISSDLQLHFKAGR